MGVALDENVDLEDENEDLQNQVYHNACLSKSGALMFDVLGVIGFVQVNNLATELGEVKSGTALCKIC